MKKRILCFALAAMLIGGNAATAIPVYAAESGTSITLTKSEDDPYIGRKYIAQSDNTVVKDIELPESWEWADPTQILTTQYADAVANLINMDGTRINYVTVKVKKETTGIIGGTKGDNNWYKSGVTIKPDDSEYLISSDKTTWTNFLSYNTQGNNTAAYYLKDSDGYVTEEKTATFNIDTNAPSGEIKIKNNAFKEILSAVTFKHFFKNTADVTITGEDETSGVAKIEYQKVAKGDTFDKDGKWTEYKSLSMKANDKSVIYARITDKAGNSTIINSEGVVVYTDSTAATDTATFTRTSAEDVIIAINGNGNTIASVKNGDDTLASTAYDFANDEFLLTNNYLKTLKAGTYTLTVSYNPLGETYEASNDNEAPATSVITLTVEKGTGSVTEISDITKTYDGKPVATPTFETTNSKGTDNANVKIEYKEQSEEDSKYTSTAPTNSGDYVVRITVAEDENYNKVSITKNFSIKKLTAQLTWSDTELTYNGAEQSVTTKISNAVSGDTFELAYEDNEKTAAGTYTAKVTGLGNDNYALPADASMDWKISYLAEGTATVSGNKGNDDWYVTKVIITPQAGYQISADGTDWKTSLEYDAQGSQTAAYYLKQTSTGFITDKKEAAFKIDTVAPTGEIKVKDNGFTEFLNTIIFKHFFKNTIDVTITGNDATSDVAKIEYQNVAKEETFDKDGKWTEYKSFSMTANDKCVIYARITDKAGNSTIINSDGVVVYKDATTKAEETFVKTSTSDVKTGITVNGNTIASVTVKNSADENAEAALIDEKNYEIKDDKLVLRNAYLKTLAAGTYTFTVSYNPYGEAYTADSKGDAPDSSVITLTVDKAKATVTVDNAAKHSGKADPEFTYKVTELAEGDSLKDILLARTAGEEAGSYDITATAKDGSNENYDITFVAGKLTIENHVKPEAPVTENRVEATCTTDGSYDEVYYCTVDNCKVEIERNNKTIKATGHTEVTDAAVTATCTENGKKAGSHCSVCNTVIKEQETVPATGHLHTEVRNAKEATYDEEGYTGDTYCTDCGTKLSSGKVIEKLTKPTDDSEKEPLIGDKTGWAEIKADVINQVKNATATSEKITITIDMNTTSKIDGGVIDAIKGKKVDIVLEMGDGISWTINGNSVTSDSVADIDLGVNKNSDMIPVDVINTVTGERSSIQISLVHNGEFGFTATLSIGLEAKNAGYYANLFFYNKEEGKLEFMNAAKIDEEGNSSLTFTHASDYSIVISDNIMDGRQDLEDDSSDKKEDSNNKEDIVDNDTANKPTANIEANATTTSDNATNTSTATSSTKTGDNSSILLWVLVMLGAGSVVVTVAAKRKRQR